MGRARMRLTNEDERRLYEMQQRKADVKLLEDEGVNTSRMPSPGLIKLPQDMPAEQLNRYAEELERRRASRKMGVK